MGDSEFREAVSAATAGYGTVAGTVTTGGTPLAGVTVNLLDDQGGEVFSVVTNASGEYDGPDEVHKRSVARAEIGRYEPGQVPEPDAKQPRAEAPAAVVAGQVAPGGDERLLNGVLRVLAVAAAQHEETEQPVAVLLDDALHLDDVTLCVFGEEILDIVPDVRPHASVRIPKFEDEKRHAAALIERMLFLEGVPDMVTREPLQIGKNVPEMLQSDLNVELAVGAALKDAIVLCEDENDFVTREILEQLLEDTEVDHAWWLEKQLGLIDKVGLQNYLQSQMG